MGSFLLAAADLIGFLFSAYIYIIIGSAIISWVNADPWNPIVRFLRGATEPAYRIIRRRFPFLSSGGIDFTPMALGAALYFLQKFLILTLHTYGVRMLAG